MFVYLEAQNRQFGSLKCDNMLLFSLDVIHDSTQAVKQSYLQHNFFPIARMF